MVTFLLGANSIFGIFSTKLATLSYLNLFIDYRYLIFDNTLLSKSVLDEQCSQIKITLPTFQHFILYQYGLLTTV